MAFDIEELEEMRESHLKKQIGDLEFVINTTSAINGLVGVGPLGFGFEGYGLGYLSTTLLLYGGGKLARKLIAKRLNENFYKNWKRKYEEFTKNLN